MRVEPNVPTGGLYPDGKVVSWRLLNAYFVWPVFFSQLIRRTPSLKVFILIKIDFINKVLTKKMTLAKSLIKKK